MAIPGEGYSYSEVRKIKFHCSACELDFFFNKKDVKSFNNGGILEFRFTDGHELFIYCPCCQMKDNVK